MKARLNREKSKLMEEVLNNPECMWEKDTKEAMQKYAINETTNWKGYTHTSSVHVKQSSHFYFYVAARPLVVRKYFQV